MKIAHEAPLSIFDQVQELTDYDYALVHLFEENDEYYNKFVEARDKGREIILDNSIFELGTAWDSDRFAYWVEKLKPTWYIVPDVLDDKDATINSFDTFVEKYPDLPGKKIGVVQGSTFNQCVECFDYLNERVDKIAFSFNSTWYQKPDSTITYIPRPINGEVDKLSNCLQGRTLLLQTLLSSDKLDVNKPIHLLGASLPQEFKTYTPDSWSKYDISVDTSCPVVNGIEGILLSKQGISSKPSVKLFELINENVVDNLDIIEYNIDIFKGYTEK